MSYRARFRHQGPTIHVGTYDTKAEADAAVAGAKALLAKPGFKDHHPPPRHPVVLLMALDSGAYDSQLDAIIERFESRRRLIGALPRQSDFGSLVGAEDRVRRRVVYGEPINDAQTVFDGFRRPAKS